MGHTHTHKSARAHTHAHMYTGDLEKDWKATSVLSQMLIILYFQYISIHVFAYLFFGRMVLVRKGEETSCCNMGQEASLK